MVEQGVGGQIKAGAGQRPGPQGGAGDGRVLGENRGGAQLLDRRMEAATLASSWFGRPMRR